MGTRHFSERGGERRGPVSGPWSASPGVPDSRRLLFQPGDFFKDDLPDAQLYVLSRILHDWADDRVHELLSRVSRSCKPGETPAAARPPSACREGKGGFYRQPGAPCAPCTLCRPLRTCRRSQEGGRSFGTISPESPRPGPRKCRHLCSRAGGFPDAPACVPGGLEQGISNPGPGALSQASEVPVAQSAACIPVPRALGDTVSACKTLLLPPRAVREHETAVHFPVCRKQPSFLVSYFAQRAKQGSSAIV